MNHSTVVSDIFGRSDTNAVTVNVQDRVFAYDLNGNLTNDGVRAYSWDEVDRLIEVRDLQTSDVLVQNRYDGLSRRRERIQLEDGILVTNRYVYDGWLVVAVLDGDNEVLEQYVHGVDLSGTREGAGGIGGILQAVGDEVAYYHYDGNGNVISATDSNAVVMTRLEYDPFGRVLVADGSYTPRYQFSSKEDDTATGLNYYGFRYYSPQLGRWPSRDPIGEQAGPGLYTFVENSPLDRVDHLGLCGVTLRRYVGRAGHQWIHYGSTNNVGFYPPGQWIDENELCRRMPNRPDPDNPDNYYEWETVQSDKGKLPDGTPCKCATCDQIEACLQSQTTGDPDPPGFSGLFGNCRKRSGQAIGSCCLKRGKMTHKPPSGQGAPSRCTGDSSGGSSWICGS